MITVTTSSGQEMLVNPNEIVSVTEAGQSSQWHGVRAYLRLNNTKHAIDIRESVADIKRLLGESK